MFFENMVFSAKSALRQRIKNILLQMTKENRKSQSDIITEKVRRNVKINQKSSENKEINQNSALKFLNAFDLFFCFYCCLGSLGLVLSQLEKNFNISQYRE